MFGGEKGSIAFFIVTAYMKGIPMIYDGQEVGMNMPIAFPFTRVKIDWSKGADITAAYKKIIAFRNSSDEIKKGDLVSMCSYDVCAFTKTFNKQQVLVIVNLRNESSKYIVPASLINTQWTNVFDQTAASIKEQIQLQPYQYIILKK
jgi:hypothetical protein